MANTTADGGGGGTSANTPNPTPVTASVDGESSAVENLSTNQTHPDSATMQDHADLGSPSPLSGAYLLIVLPEPHSEEHKDVVLKRLHKALLSWDVTETQVDIDRELLDVATQAPQGEESKNGEKLVQLASDSLVIEILVHPEINTFRQCLRNLLASFTRHRHIIHMGYTLSGSGSWILQDGTFEFSEFLDIIQDTEVQRLLRVYDGAISLDIHCAPEGRWGSDTLLSSPVAKSMKIAMNPPDKLDSSAPGLSKFIQYMCDVLPAIPIETLLEPSDVVGNIRFSHPTLYVFPAGQGDAALFGISGFNILVDGGFGRKPCFWDFARHMDRLDAVLMTRANMSSLCGLSSAIRRKAMNPVYPQMGHVFCNIPEVDGSISPEGLKDQDPLIVHMMDVCQVMANSIKSLHMTPQPAYRENSIEPINLYHKVGHGTLDMYVISPQRDSKEVKEFLHLWKLGNAGDLAAARGTVKLGGKPIEIPLLDLVSICALVVWQPADPTEAVTRILFPGSAPQQKILEGFEKLRHLDFLKLPTCTGSKLAELPPTKAKVKPAPEKSEKKITTTPRPVSEPLEVKQVRSVAAAPRKLDLEEKLNKINEAKSGTKTDSRETLSKSDKKEKDNEKVKEAAAKPAKKSLKAAESSGTEEKPPTPRPKTEVKSRVDSNLATAKADSMELKKKADIKPVSKPKPPAEKAAAAAPKKEAASEATPKLANQIAPKVKKEVANMKVAEAKVSTTTKAAPKKAEEIKKKPEKPAAEDKDKEVKAAEKPQKKVRSKSKEKKPEEKEAAPKAKAAEAPKAAKPKPKAVEVKEKPVKVKVETKKESTPPKEAKKESKEKPKAAAKPAATAAAPAKPKEVKKETKAAEKKKPDAKPSAGSTQAKAVKRPPKPVENGTAAAAAAAAAVVVATAAGISAGETVADIAQETAVEEVFVVTEAPEAASAPPAVAAETQENGEAEKVCLVETVEADMVVDEVEMDKTDDKEEEEDDEKAQETSIDDVLEHETSTEDIKEHEISTEEKVLEDAEEVEDEEEKESTLSEDDLAKHDEEKEEIEVDEEKEEEKQVDEEKEEELEVEEDDQKVVEEKEHDIDAEGKEREDHVEPTEEDALHVEEEQSVEEVKQLPVEEEEVKEKTGLFSKLEKAVVELKEVIGDALAKKGEKEATEDTSSITQAAEVPEVPVTETKVPETIDLDFRQTVPSLKGDIEDIVDHAAPIAQQEAPKEPKETRDVEEKDVDEVYDKLEHEDARRESITSVHEEFQAEIITKDYVLESIQVTGISQKTEILHEVSHEPLSLKEDDHQEVEISKLVQDLQEEHHETDFAGKKHDEVTSSKVFEKTDLVLEATTKTDLCVEDHSLEHEIPAGEPQILQTTDVKAEVDDGRAEIPEAKKQLSELEREDPKSVPQQGLEENLPAQEATFSAEIHAPVHKEQKLEDSQMDVEFKVCVSGFEAAEEPVPATEEESKSKDLSPKEQNLEEIQAAIEMTGRKLLEDIVPHHEDSLSTPELSPVIQKEEKGFHTLETADHGTDKVPEFSRAQPETTYTKEEVLERVSGIISEPEHEDFDHKEETYSQGRVPEMESGKVPEHHEEDFDYSGKVLSAKVPEHDRAKSPVPREAEQVMEHQREKVPEHEEEEQIRSSCEAETLESKLGTFQEEEKLTGTSYIVQAATIHPEVPQIVDTYDKISPSDDRSSEKSVSPAPRETQNDYIKNGVTPELSEPSSRGSDHGDSRKDQSPSGMSLSAAFGTLQELQAQVTAASSDKQQQLHEGELDARAAEQLKHEQAPLSPHPELSSLDKTQQHPDVLSLTQQDEVKEHPIKDVLSYDYELEKAPVTPLSDLSQSEQPESHEEPIREPLSHEEPIKEPLTHEKELFKREQHVQDDIIPHEVKGAAVEADDLHKTRLTPHSDVSSASFSYEKDRSESLQLDPTAAATLTETEFEDLQKAPLTPRSDVSSKSLDPKEQHDEEEHLVQEPKFPESVKSAEVDKVSITSHGDVSAFSQDTEEQQHVEIQQPVKEQDFAASKLEAEEERVPVTPVSDASIHSPVLEQQFDLQQHVRDETVPAAHDSDKPSAKAEASSLNLSSSFELHHTSVVEDEPAKVAAHLEREKDTDPITPHSDVSGDSYVDEEHVEKETFWTTTKTEPFSSEPQQHVKEEAAPAKIDIPAAKLEPDEEKLFLTPSCETKIKSDHYEEQLDLQQHPKEATAVPSPRSDISTGSHAYEEQHELEQHTKNEPTSLKVEIPTTQTDTHVEKDLLTPRSDISAKSYIEEEQQRKEVAADVVARTEEKLEKLPIENDKVPNTPRSDVSSESYAFEQQHVKEEIFSASFKTDVLAAESKAEVEKVPLTPRSDVSADSFGYELPQNYVEEAAEIEHESVTAPKLEAEKSQVPLSLRSDVSAESFHYEQQLQQHGKEFTETAADPLDTTATKLDVQRDKVPASPRSDASTETYSYEEQLDLQQPSAYDETHAAAHKTEAKFEVLEGKVPVSPLSDVTLESYSNEKQQPDLQQHDKEESFAEARKTDARGAELDTKEEPKAPLTPRSDVSDELRFCEQHQQLDLQQHEKEETLVASKFDSLATKVEHEEENAPLTPRSDISADSYVYEQHEQLQQHIKEESAALNELDSGVSKLELYQEEKTPLTPRSDVSSASYVEQQHEHFDLQQHSKEDTAFKTEPLFTEVHHEYDKAPLTPHSDISVKSDVHEQLQQPVLQQHTKEEVFTVHKIDNLITKLETEEERARLTPRSDISSESYVLELEQQQQLQRHSDEETLGVHKTDTLITKEETEEERAPVTPRSDISSESYVLEQQQLQQHGQEETFGVHKTDTLVTKVNTDEERAPLNPRSDISSDSFVQEERQQQLDLHSYSKDETASPLKTKVSASKHEDEQVPLTPCSDISAEADHYEQHFDSQQHAKEESQAAAHKPESLTGKAEPEDVKVSVSPRSDTSADSSLLQKHQFDLQQHSLEETVAPAPKIEALATKREDRAPTSPRSDISGDSYVYGEQQQQHAKEETAANSVKTDPFLSDPFKPDEHNPPASPRSDVSSEPHSLEQQHVTQEASFTVSKQGAGAALFDRDEDKIPVTPRSDISRESSFYDRHVKEETLPAAVSLSISTEKEAGKDPLTPRSDVSDSSASYMYEQQLKKDTSSPVQKLDTGAAQLDAKEEQQQLPITPRSDVSIESCSYEQQEQPGRLESDSRDVKKLETEVATSGKQSIPVEEDSAVLKSGFSSSSTTEAAWLQSSEQFPAASAYSYSQDYDRDLERREYYPEHPAADYSATYTEEYTTTTETEDWQHYGHHEQDPDPNYRYEQHYDESYPQAYDDSYGYEDPYAAEYPEEHAASAASTNQSNLTSTQVKESDPARKDNVDPLSSWGKPLGLPAPIPPVAINGHDSRKSPHKKAKTGKPQEKQPQPQQQESSFYVDLAYVPHHANPNYCDADFFKRIKARHYVLSALEPSTQVLNALVEGKESWSGDDKDLDVTIIPTYDSDALGLWVSTNEETLARNRIDLAPSASRCTINLQDHETACSAYRLEF